MGKKLINVPWTKFMGKEGYKKKIKAVADRTLKELWSAFGENRLNITLAILVLLWLHVNFRIICSSFVKNVLSIFIGIALNL